MFQPGRIGNLVLKNRIVKSPQSTGLSNMDGTVTQRSVNHYKRLAEGGTSLVMTEYTYIDDDAAKAIHCQLGNTRREHVPGLGWLVDEVHAAGAKIGMQLAHGGRQKFLGTAPIKAASDISWDEVEAQYGVKPVAMTVAEIEQVMVDFGDAALLAEHGVQVRTSARALAVDEQGVRVANAAGGEDVLAAGTVVIACGYAACGKSAGAACREGARPAGRAGWHGTAGRPGDPEFDS